MSPAVIPQGQPLLLVTVLEAWLNPRAWRQEQRPRAGRHPHQGALRS